MDFCYICKMKPKEVILVGAGGHALSLAEFSVLQIAGYLAAKENEKMPGKWLGNDENALPLIKNGNHFHIAFVYSGLPRMQAREKLIEKYQTLGAKFSTLIAPSAIVTQNSIIGEGTAVMTGAIINRANLGRHVVINSGAIIEHDCSIGNNTFIGPGTVVGGFTNIGCNCFIGLGARIGNDITIADNISVAMGAVVNRNLTEPGIYHGNPLRCFKGRT